MAKPKRRYKGGYLRQRFTIDGKQYEVYAETREELNKKEAQKREEIEKGIQDVYNPTLNNYYNHFTDVRRRELKESTIRAQGVQYRCIASVSMTANLKFGEMRIKDITRRDIETAREKLLRDGKTPQHLNNCFAHLNHVFNAAVLDDTIQKNPCKLLKQLKREAPLIGENKHRALTIEETQRFFKAAAERNSYYTNDFLIMIKTGARIGEIAALYQTDIDRKKGFIHIRRTVTRNEIGGYEIGNSTKTYSGKRDIPLTTEVIEIIKNQQELNRALFGLEQDGLLFKSAEGDILREYGANREIKRICKAAEIEPFTCHAFRNTFATRFIEQQPENYKILSEILGHKDVSITLNLYTHVMAENKIIAMNDIMIKTG